MQSNSAPRLIVVHADHGGTAAGGDIIEAGVAPCEQCETRFVGRDRRICRRCERARDAASRHLAMVFCLACVTPLVFLGMRLCVWLGLAPMHALSIAAAVMTLGLAVWIVWMWRRAARIAGE